MHNNTLSRNRQSNKQRPLQLYRYASSPPELMIDDMSSSRYPRLSHDPLHRCEYSTDPDTHWDAKALGAGLEEGKRYMVSEFPDSRALFGQSSDQVTNLMPSKNGNWQKRPGSLGEVYLQSRRDTRWQIIE